MKLFWTSWESIKMWQYTDHWILSAKEKKKNTSPEVFFFSYSEFITRVSKPKVFTKKNEQPLLKISFDGMEIEKDRKYNKMYL